MVEELEDFEAFLHPDFSPVEFSNELLLATNSSTDNAIDLTTPSKRLGFDLIEIDKRLNRLTSTHHEVVYADLCKTEEIQGLIGMIQPSLRELNGSFAKLQEEILKPYDESMELHDALKKIHTTSILLRSVQFFLYLVQNLQESVDHYDDSTKGLIKIVKNYKQLKSHMVDNNSSNFHLKSLKLTKEYQAVLPTQEFKVKNMLMDKFRQLGSLTDPSINNLIIAFNIFNHELFEKSVMDLVNNLVSTSSNNLIKTLTNPKNFPQTISQILLDARPILILQYYIEKNSIVLQHKNLISIFYRDVAKFFEINIKKIYNKGGPVSKNLKNYQSLMETGIKESITKSDFNGIVKNDGLETRMMLNSINCLNTTRR